MVMKLRETGCRATVCSDMEAASALLLQRWREFDFVVAADTFGSVKLKRMELLCTEKGLKLVGMYTFRRNKRLPFKLGFS
uniref:Uncharacterized protein n=1 Tax=Oryza barthii TaxID=65489 RepID=A0A0D3EMZ2_9ORYZ